MLDIAYEKIAMMIDPALTVSRDGDFVYLLYPNPPINRNILFQETENALIVWSNEYYDKPMYEVFSIIARLVDEDLIFPFVESEEEYRAVMALGAVPTDFDDIGCEDLCREYGSFLLKKERYHHGF